jgi:mannosyltransferase OCH1-like enzyme
MKRFRFKSVIPLHVYLTWKTKILPPLMQHNLNMLHKQNPEFKFHVYDDEDCRNFIRTHFHSGILGAFDGLVPGAYKADLFRLCILYIHGGYYMDIKLKCINGFKLIDLSESEHFVLDRPNHSLHIYNAFMVCKKNNIFLKACIQQIEHNVRVKYYGQSNLSPTGPELLGRIAQHFPIVIDLVYPRQFNDHIMYNGTLIIQNYPGYRKEQSTSGGVHYSKQWDDKTIYIE